jgi:hypothetical protein
MTEFEIRIVRKEIKAQKRYDTNNLTVSESGVSFLNKEQLLVIENISKLLHVQEYTELKQVNLYEIIIAI